MGAENHSVKFNPKFTRRKENSSDRRRDQADVISQEKLEMPGEVARHKASWFFPDVGREIGMATKSIVTCKLAYPNAFEKPFSVICPAALLASPALEMGDRNASPEVFFGLILKESFENSWQA
ncbi:hypothetical protein DUI87_15584 [Hirundo rustica rustica]|uniref:Uncharacterized protein n=1 Tax=Hirundo rustica rustica TaxID=333673 RepID=A0A3M0K4G8_HIRRU|nr:hypothetical protein DUI87_15584 [Hirundo rustica rustica]